MCLTIEMAERALVIYIGQATKENFRVGLGRATWGFKNYRPEYAALQPGDWIIFGVTATGGPRVPPEDWAKFELAEVVVGRLTSSLFSDSEPLWPDENEAVSYPNRVTFEVLGERSQVPLVPGELGPSVIEGLRRSGTGGQGVVVPSDGELLDGLAAKVSPHVLNDTALLDRIGKVRQSPQSYGPAPHKPLLLLLARPDSRRAFPALRHFASTRIDFVISSRNSAEKPKPSRRNFPSGISRAMDCGKSSGTTELVSFQNRHPSGTPQ